MPNQNETMTAAKAIIKVNGVAVGYMKNLRCSETKQLGSVMGLGNVTKKELPLLAITCTWSCDFYMIDLKKSGIPGLDNRDAMSTQQYIDTQVLAKVPLDIVIYKKDIKTISNNIVTATKNTVFAAIKNVYLNSTSFSVVEMAISDFNQSGEYTEPILTL